MKGVVKGDAEMWWMMVRCGGCYGGVGGAKEVWRCPFCSDLAKTSL